MSFIPPQPSKGSSTHLLYLDDQYALSASALIVSCAKLEDGFAIIPDRTPMYVRRGGQPSDAGIIEGDGFQLVVQNIRTDELGRVQHVGLLLGRTPNPGETIDITVDAGTRQLHSLWHSAGEAVIVAAKMAGFDETVCGAIHYGPNQNRIEYEGRLRKEAAERLRSDIQLNLARIIKDNTSIVTFDLIDRRLVIERCGFWPKYIPEGNRVRVIQVRPDYTGRPCTGTHVKSTRELGKVKVEKIKVKGNRTIVSYNCGER